MSLDSFLNMFETKVSGVTRVQPSNGADFGCNPTEKQRVSGIALDTPDTSRNPEGYQRKPRQDKGCTPDTPNTQVKAKSENKTVQWEECCRRLAWIASHLDADLDGLLDWYKDDMEDIAIMCGKDLLSIVREYLSLRDYYRGSQWPNFLFK